MVVLVAQNYSNNAQVHLEALCSIYKLMLLQINVQSARH